MTIEPPGRSGGHPGPHRPHDGTAPWWEDDRGWAEDDDGWGEWPRRRRSRFLKWTGIAVAAALVLASAGSLVDVLLAGRSTVVLPTSGAKFTVIPPNSGQRARVEIRFRVENPTGSAVTPQCTVAVVEDGRYVVRPVVVSGSSLAAGATRTGTLDVIASSPQQAEGPAEVDCRT